ncbi:LacI family DNA-binding transcriptional regulator [Streptomyces lycii]|uniref:LacI family transcriptional regulator n=1 Tax=Streptomyces lycii TaxID=2654337 RepID=A0ABQ7FMR0_9ACTN|nr:LacI family DNA-binding transcriptional regulator [Streptomyces lycii]KAF4410221.1 LacI family transcriptional regulator [Streptomyces lycii]
MTVEDAGQSRSKVTITAIAQEAGVSVPTVSRVVNGRSDVSPETRARVEDLLRRHGYQRRVAAAARERAGLLDLVFSDLDSPWAVEIIRGVEEVAHAAGMGTVVSATHGRTGATRQWMENLRDRASDGVILVTSAIEPPLQEELRRLDVPVVVVDPEGSPALETPTVGATNWAGGMAATEHLLELGHRRIGFIAGPARLLCSRARMDGYRTALEAADVPADEALVVRGDFYHESGFTGCQALMDLPEPPTAIFASSDQMALGAIEALRRRGLRVPDDISVIGFDDLPEMRWASPPLTTVRQPLAEMGKVAARTVLRQSRGEELDSPRVELATELVVRASTAPPRDQAAAPATPAAAPAPTAAPS